MTAFREGHSIVAIVWPIPLEQIFFSRPQRILCYYCELQMALTVMAIFFGADQEGKMAVSWCRAVTMLWLLVQGHLPPQSLRLSAWLRVVFAGCQSD